MKKRIAIFFVLLLLVGGVGFYVSKIIFNKAPAIKSYVAKVNDIPRIFINGKEKELLLSDWYYYPNTTVLNETSYKKGEWLISAKKVIVDSIANGANTLVLRVWWSDLDTATIRPNGIDSSLDFKDFDEAMNYAEQKGIYVILYPALHKMIPEWWIKENDFPPYVLSPESITPCIPAEKDASTSCIPKEICAKSDLRCCTKPKEELICATPAVDISENGGPQAKIATNGMLMVRKDEDSVTPYKTCKECETDSYGWKYNYPSMGSKTIQNDYSEFLKAVISRYKDHPALIGWLSSVGPTGEDIYSDYVQIRGIYGGLMGETPYDQIPGYSNFSQSEFKVWIKNKYKGDTALRGAWGDPTLSLSNIKIPDANNLLKDPNSKKGFPDDFSLNYFVKLEDLNQKGKDLYEFREYVRENSRNSFISLFKSLDPNHILIYQGTNNDGILNNPNIDGIYSNNHVEYSLDKNEQSTLIFTFIARAIKSGKASLFGIESKGISGKGLTGSSDLDQQKQALVLTGKVTKCMGGYTGYASGLETDKINGPIWSKDDVVGLKDIINYTSQINCICGLIKPSDTILKDHTLNEFINLFNLQDYYVCRGYDLNSKDNTNTTTPEGQQGNPKCGDGVCDSVEKSSGMCSLDCDIVKKETDNTPTENHSAPTPPTQEQQSSGKCGDGVCDTVERTSGMCSVDCK
ncbi:MAG: family 14 glycosylhydrolase [Candidatus Paceibacterota bacterium]